jgi:hypothetical protein
MRGNTLSAIILIVVAASAQEVPRGARLVDDIRPIVSINDENLDKLEQIDQSCPLTDYLASVRTLAPEGCPTIYSAWYCDLLKSRGETKQVEHELRVRAYGGKLLIFVKKQSEMVIASSASAAGQQHAAELLLDLADWIAKGDGLGNGEIASHCRAIASVALAYVIVGQNGSIDEQVLSLIERAWANGERGWAEWTVRAHEHEVPGSVAPFVRTPGKGEEPRHVLLKADTRAEVLIKDKLSAKSQSASSVNPVESAAQLRQELPPELAVYVSDRASWRSTASEDRWDSYSFLHYGRHLRIAADLRTTCLFLGKIGAFPDIKPLAQLNQADRDRLAARFYLSVTEVAFANAWSKFSDGKEFVNSNQKIDPKTGLLYIDRNTENLSATYHNLNVGTVAARIYDDVKTGHWSDYLLDDAPPPQGSK